ncbi:hypothetical protein [Chroococcidiopsis cubana]|nr:hypothetical protein [Chroococcidiopsis cubana]
MLGPEDILISDVGAHKMWIARNYHCVLHTCLSLIVLRWELQFQGDRG